ncbi:SET domain-containing protein [Hypoxylon sp. FL0543]|nr:SET domain-containing protein [Hypoxylon sp. FL0543]
MSALSATDTVEQGTHEVQDATSSDGVSIVPSNRPGLASDSLASDDGDGNDTVSQSPKLLAWTDESCSPIDLNPEKVWTTEVNSVPNAKPVEKTDENRELVDDNSELSASAVSSGSRSPSSLEASDTDQDEGPSSNTTCTTEEAATVSPDFAEKVEAVEPLAYGEVAKKDLASPEQYSNDFIEIKESQLGGKGVFAKTDLKRGQIILAEKPLISASPMNLYREIEKLEPELQQAFHRLHGYKRSLDQDDRHAIFMTNAFAIDELSCVYIIASRFNHACPPSNSVGNRVTGGRVMEFRMKRDVPAGTELTIAYGRLSPLQLYRMWGFRCSCGGCTPITDEEIAQIEGEADAEGIW